MTRVSYLRLSLVGSGRSATLELRHKGYERMGAQAVACRMVPLRVRRSPEGDDGRDPQHDPTDTGSSGGPASSTSRKLD